jgi:hypothetical protein
MMARSSDDGAVEQASILLRTIANRGGPRYLTRRLSNPSAESGGEHSPTEAATLAQETPGTGRDLPPPLFAWSAAPRDVRHVINQPGHPLGTAALGRFQSSFGHDFTSVRVHADERAAASAAMSSLDAVKMRR